MVTNEEIYGEIFDDGHRRYISTNGLKMIAGAHAEMGLVQFQAGDYEQAQKAGQLSTFLLDLANQIFEMQTNSKEGGINE